ncbi:hypothetical protein CHUAL_009608 [Chamberlinius hualienensis]
MGANDDISKSVHPRIINLNCDKELDKEMRYNMVIGIIKHILYHREQIPQPYSTITEKEIFSNDSKQGFLETKLKTLLQELQELFKNLREILVDNAAEEDTIQRVMVALGNNLLTTKEIHCIEIPKLLYSGHSQVQQTFIF